MTHRTLSRSVDTMTNEATYKELDELGARAVRLWRDVADVTLSDDERECARCFAEDLEHDIAELAASIR